MRLAAWPLLVLLLAVPALWLVHLRAERRRAARLAALVDGPLAGLLPPDRRAEHRRRVALGLGALAAIAMALAQPQWGPGEQDLVLRGRDLVVVLDVSLSMLAEDTPPNRLARAKAAARSLVESLGADSGHRLALVTFAGRPEVSCPLTRDWRLFLDRLESASVDDLPQRGSALGGALLKALDMLGGPDPAFTDLILLTDGEDHGGQAVEAARLLAGRGVGLHPVGIGDPARAVPIPIEAGGGRPEHLVHKGVPVETRPRPGLLVAMAEAAGSRYLAIEAGEPSLAELYRRAIAPKPWRRLETASGAELGPRFQLALALALGLLALDALWPGRREDPR
jgi:Ca-activated chloride channel family protein